MLRSDLKKMKNMSLKGALSFFWIYYWPWILGFLLILSCVLYDVTANYGKKDTVLYATMINSAGEETQVLDAWLTAAGYDPEQQGVEVHCYTLNYENPDVSDATTLQTVSAYFGMGNMDVFFSDERCFGNFAVLGGFEDLREVLPDYLLEEHEEQLYIVKQDSGRLCLAGIRLSEHNPMVAAGIYEPGTLLGIVSNTENMAAAATFLRWMLIDGVL